MKLKTQVEQTNYLRVKLGELHLESVGGGALFRICGRVLYLEYVGWCSI